MNATYKKLTLIIVITAAVVTFLYIGIVAAVNAMNNQVASAGSTTELQNFKISMQSPSPWASSDGAVQRVSEIKVANGNLKSSQSDAIVHSSGATSADYSTTNNYDNPLLNDNTTDMQVYTNQEGIAFRYKLSTPVSFPSGKTATHYDVIYKTDYSDSPSVTYKNSLLFNSKSADKSISFGPNSSDVSIRLSNVSYDQNGQEIIEYMSLDGLQVDLYKNGNLVLPGSYVPASQTDSAVDEILFSSMLSSNIIANNTFRGISFDCKWKQLSHTVSFVTNGGTEISPIAVPEGQSVARPATDPIKDGYVFGGWYVDDELSTQYDFNQPVQKDIKLYAKWNDIYSIVYRTSSNGTTTGPSACGEGLSLTVDTYSNSNYKFDHMNIVNLDSKSVMDTVYSTTFVMPACNIEIESFYTENVTAHEAEVSIAIDDETHGMLTTNIPSKVDINTSYRIDGDSVFVGSYKATCIPISGFELVEWVNETNTVEKSGQLFANTVFKAVTKPIAYSINYFDMGGQAFSGKHSEEYLKSFTVDSEIYLDTPVRSDYTFEGYYLDSECLEDPISKIEPRDFNSDINLYAKWKSHTVTFTPSAKVKIDNYPLQAGQFTFTLYDSDNNILQSTTNSEDGIVVFQPIVYSTEGKFEYKIQQGTSQQPGIICDDHILDISVTVDEGDDNQLNSYIIYAGEILFDNYDSNLSNKVETEYAAMSKSEITECKNDVLSCIEKFKYSSFEKLSSVKNDISIVYDNALGEISNAGNSNEIDIAKDTFYDEITSVYKDCSLNELERLTAKMYEFVSSLQYLNDDQISDLEDSIDSNSSHFETKLLSSDSIESVKKYETSFRDVLYSLANEYTSYDIDNFAQKAVDQIENTDGLTSEDIESYKVQIRIICNTVNTDLETLNGPSQALYVENQGINYINNLVDEAKNIGSVRVKDYNYVKVYFETNGGSSIDPVRVDKGQLLARPKDPVKEGKSLEGWYLDKELTQKYDFNVAVEESFTLYANWKVGEIVVPNSVDVKVDPTYLNSIVENLKSQYPDAEKVTVMIQANNVEVDSDEVTLINDYVNDESIVFKDVSLTAYVDDEEQVGISDYNQDLIPVTYSFNFLDILSVETHRVHNGQHSLISETPNENGEYVQYNRGENKIVVWAKKYSTYGFAYLTSLQAYSNQGLLESSSANSHNGSIENFKSILYNNILIIAGVCALIALIACIFIVFFKRYKDGKSDKQMDIYYDFLDYDKTRTNRLFY